MTDAVVNIVSGISGEPLLTLSLPCVASLADVKQEISRRFGPQCAQQRLLLNSRVLSDGWTLRGCIFPLTLMLVLVDFSEVAGKRLLRCAQCCDARGVELALADRGDPNALDGWRHSALHFSADLGGEKVVQLLCRAQADVNQLDRQSRTPLYVAALYNSICVAKALLDYRADVERTDHAGAFPLWVAARGGNIEIVRALLESGAKIHLKHLGLTPLAVASKYGHGQAAQILCDADKKSRRPDVQEAEDRASAGCAAV